MQQNKTPQPLGEVVMGKPIDVIPIGTYDAIFAGLVSGGTHSEYGPSVKFQFEIVKGKEKGKIATRICDSKNGPNPKNAYGRFLAAVAGGEIAEGEVFDPGTYIGKPYRIAMEQTANGQGTRVSTIVKMGD